ncbi:hypothetical protein H9Y05_01355 [Crocinitomicaceae bacterium CZZ-1]|uniref:Uncharacterized protein n=1 Tax=Taishania pollutisoli TaxID=2766479 RepID=A0A8J6TYJ9_9FLAO|nr:hypothetical protein [Taishania pollutisoli]MBC9811108.1 hypothetical protein [Taishania pollutisoli]MBX2947977.1 hypothetical protein [Crocinitomicaceae bacterium]
MDIQSLLKNETVKSTLTKIGISEDKQPQVVDQAYELIRSKAFSDPKALSSLLSSKPNTVADNQLQSALQSDFVKQLISKVGLSDDMAKKVADSLPELLKHVDLNMITDLLGSFTQSSGNSKQSKSGGVAGLFGFIGQFFKK